MEKLQYHLMKNWIVYIGIIGFIWLVVAAYLNGRREEKKRQSQNNSQENTQK